MSRNSPRRKRRKKLQLFSNGPPCSKSNSLFRFILEIGDFSGEKMSEPLKPSFRSRLYFHSFTVPSFLLLIWGPLSIFFGGGRKEAGFIEAEGGKKRSRQNFRNCATFFGFFIIIPAPRISGGKGGGNFIFTSRNLSKCTKGNLEEEKKALTQTPKTHSHAYYPQQGKRWWGRAKYEHKSIRSLPKKMENDIKTNSFFSFSLTFDISRTFFFLIKRTIL